MSNKNSGVQPATILPAFIGLPQSKLAELLDQGFQISGLAIERRVEGADPVRGFIDVDGLVGWWTPGMQALERAHVAMEALRVRCEQAEAAIDAAQAVERERDELRAQVEALSKSQEPVHWRAILAADQVPHQLKTSMHIVGFLNKGSADQFVAEQLDFQGWRYALEPLYAHPAPHPSLTRPSVPEGWEQVEAIAVARYKVAASDQSMFHRHAVVAGDGKQQLYLGREVECEIMARKFANAFLDGAFVAQGLLAAPRPEAYAPLTPEEVRDLTCMHSGAPWSDAHLAALGEVIVVYEQLRREGNRPVDPATLPEASGCVSTFQESETQAVLSAEKSTPPTGLMTMAIKALTDDARRYRWLTDDSASPEMQARVKEVAASIHLNSKAVIDFTIDGASQLTGPQRTVAEIYATAKKGGA